MLRRTAEITGILTICIFLGSHASAEEPGTKNPQLLAAIKLYESRKEVEAIKSLNEALKWKGNTSSDIALIYIYGGLCNFNLGSEAGAKHALEQALKIKPDVTLPAGVSSKAKEFFSSVKATLIPQPVKPAAAPEPVKPVAAAPAVKPGEKPAAAPEPAKPVAAAPPAEAEKPAAAPEPVKPVAAAPAVKPAEKPADAPEPEEPFAAALAAEAERLAAAPEPAKPDAPAPPAEAEKPATAPEPVKPVAAAPQAEKAVSKIVEADKTAGKPLAVQPPVEKAEKKISIFKRQPIWTWVALGVGAASIGTGARFGVVANSDRDKANSATVATTSKKFQDRSESEALTANVLYGVGAAAIAAGAVIFFISGDTQPVTSWQGIGPMSVSFNF